MAYDNFLMDKRVVDRNIAKGLVDAQAYKQAVEALPDRESNCVRVSLEGDAGAADSRLEDEGFDDADELDDEDEDDEEDESDELAEG